MVVLENYIGANGETYYVPMGKPYISDIKGIDIECLNCNKEFRMDLTLHAMSMICVHCGTSYYSFINDGTIMINTNNFKDHIRYKISFVEWR